MTESSHDPHDDSKEPRCGPHPEVVDLWEADRRMFFIVYCGRHATMIYDMFSSSSHIRCFMFKSNVLCIFVLFT